MTYTLIAYKPSSSHAACSRGCCGTNHWDSDFNANSDLDAALLKEKLAHYLAAELEHHEDGWEFLIFENGKCVLRQGDNLGELYEDDEIDNSEVRKIYDEAAGERQAIEDERKRQERLLEMRRAEKARQEAEQRERAEYERLKAQFEGTK